MEKRSLGILLAAMLLIPTLGSCTDASLQNQTLVVELDGLSGPQQKTISLPESDAQHVLEILDTVNKRLQNASTSEEQYQLYYSAVNQLYSYGVFGELSRTQAEKLVTFWYRARPKHLAVSLLHDMNAFCLVSGNTSCTSLGRFAVNLMFSAGWFCFSYAYMHFYEMPFNKAERWLFGGFLLMLLCIGPMWLVNLNPFSLVTILSIGEVDFGKIYYGNGSVSTLGILGFKTWQGSVRGILPGTYALGLQNALYGFTGIQIGLLSSKPGTHYLGSAFVAGITEG